MLVLEVTKLGRLLHLCLVPFSAHVLWQAPHPQHPGTVMPLRMLHRVTCREQPLSRLYTARYEGGSRRFYFKTCLAQHDLRSAPDSHADAQLMYTARYERGSRRFYSKTCSAQHDLRSAPDSHADTQLMSPDLQETCMRRQELTDIHVFWQEGNLHAKHQAVQLMPRKELVY